MVGFAVAAAMASIVAGHSASGDPTVALALTAALGVVCLAIVAPMRYLICGLLVYVPLSGWLVGYAPGSASSVLRYGPEALAALVLALTLANPTARRRSWRPIMPVLAVLAAAWGASALYSGVSTTTALIGFRAELRWLPLALVIAATADLRTDARLYARAIAAAGAIEAVIAVAERFGGPSVRAFFAPHYSIVLGGQLVTTSAAPRLYSIAGTFTDYNSLSTFLLFAWTVILLAGRPVLGWPRTVFAACLVALPAIIVMSGSREATAACLLAGVVIGQYRYRLPTIRYGLTFFAIAIVVASVASTTTVLNPNSRADLKSRWAAVLNPSTYSVEGSNNFRLRLMAEESDLVVGHHPVFGYGPGSVVDPLAVPDGRSPLLLIPAGLAAIRFGYIFDSNWGIVLVETGIGGTVAMLALLSRLVVLGWRARSRWYGLGLVALIPSSLALGFFEPIFQNTSCTLVLWVLAGLTFASGGLLSERDPT